MDPTDDDAMRDELRRLQSAGLKVPELDAMEATEVGETRPPSPSPSRPPREQLEAKTKTPWWVYPFLALVSIALVVVGVACVWFFWWVVLTGHYPW